MLRCVVALAALALAACESVPTADPIPENVPTVTEAIRQAYQGQSEVLVGGRLHAFRMDAGHSTDFVFAYDLLTEGAPGAGHATIAIWGWSREIRRLDGCQAIISGRLEPRENWLPTGSAGAIEIAGELRDARLVHVFRETCPE